MATHNVVIRRVRTAGKPFQSLGIGWNDSISHIGKFYEIFDLGSSKYIYLG